MHNSEPTYKCPVCLNTEMNKIEPKRNIGLVLDFCPKCGGIWFDQGEITRLRQLNSKSFFASVKTPHAAKFMFCHECGSVVDRNGDQCEKCKWKNLIKCPVCSDELTVKYVNDLKLDVCIKCKGAWFDHLELAEIWNMEINKRKKSGSDETDFYYADVLFPDLLVYEAVDAGIGLAANVASSLPVIASSAVEGTADVAGVIVEGSGELAGAVVDGTGELASSVFEVIADILSGI